MMHLHPLSTATTRTTMPWLSPPGVCHATCRPAIMSSSQTIQGWNRQHAAIRRSPNRISTAAAASTALAAVVPLAVKAAGAVVLGLPACIALDAAVDRAQDRVGRVSNGSTQGIKFYIAGGLDAAAGMQGQKRPAVVLIHQIFGLQPRETDLCDELARQGYIAIAPDTFQGRATTWIPRALTLAYPAALRAGAQWGVPEVHKVMQWLQQQPGVDPARIAVVGFCYGGGAAIRYAAAHPDAVAAVGVFYGRPLTEAAQFAKLQAPILGIYGGRDQQFSESAVDEFEARLRQSGVEHRIERYPQEGHAFVTDLAATQQAGTASAGAWTALLKFLGRHLQNK